MSNLYQYEVNIGRTSPGLAIKAGSSAVAKVATTCQASLKGNLFPVTAKDISLATYTLIDPTTGAITTAPLTVQDQMQTTLTVYADRSATAGVVTLGKGAEVSKSSNYIDTNIDKSQNHAKAILGYIYIKNETGAEFVGGTTALDASNLSTIYTNAVSPLGI